MFRLTRIELLLSLNQKRRHSSKAALRPGAAGSRRLRFEPLEERRLLSITVNTLIDENDGTGAGGISLRDAISVATPGDTIDFAVSGTIRLDYGELWINKNLTITGPVRNSLTIDAGERSRVFLVYDAADGAWPTWRSRD